ncbi:MAG: hypothetical protein K0Q55_1029 [Verrucomicrobia bacterium]|jgi:hypothetical protein|nr:hypothetical protein [Verrucomicrobiota bacterium]
MPGSKPALSCLQARKQLLLLESELNRAQFRSDCASLSQEVSAIVEEGRSWVNTASMLFTGFKAVRRMWSDKGDSRPRQGVFSSLLQLIRTGASIWMKIRGGKV